MIWLLACTGAVPGDEAFPAYRYSHIGALDAADERLLITGGSSEEGRRVDAWAFQLSSEEWTQLGEPPESMFRSTLVSRGDQAWVFAGTGGDGQVSDRLWQWDMSTDVWAARSQGPEPRYKAAAVRVGDEMLVHGGRDKVDDEDLTRADLWVYDLDEDSWRELETEGGPGPLTRQALLWDERAGKVWLSGGIDEADDRHSWLWSLDWETGAWTMVADDEQGLPDHASHSFWMQGERLCVWGGSGSDHDIWCFDDEGWTVEGSEGPTTRDAQVFDVTEDGALAWMMGGDGHDDEIQPNFLNDVWSLELASLTWRERSPTTP